MRGLVNRFYFEDYTTIARDTHLRSLGDSGSGGRGSTPDISIDGHEAFALTCDRLSQYDPPTDKGIHPRLSIMGSKPLTHQWLEEPKG